MTLEELQAQLQRGEAVEAQRRQSSAPSSDPSLTDAQDPVAEALAAGEREEQRRAVESSQGLGDDVIKDLPEDVSPLANYVRAFNKQFFETTMLPAEAVNEALGWIGLGLYKPGEITQAQKDLWQLLFGTRSDPVDGLSARIGHETFNGVATLSTLMASAPAMAAKQGISATQYITNTLRSWAGKNPEIMVQLEREALAKTGAIAAGATMARGGASPVREAVRTLGQGLLDNPTGAMAAQLGASAGAQTTKEISQAALPEGASNLVTPTAELLGGMAGGSFVSAASRGAKALTQKVVGGAGRLAEKVAEPFVTPASEPALQRGVERLPIGARGRAALGARISKIAASQEDQQALRSPLADPEQLRIYSKEQVEGALLKMEQAAQAAIQSIPRSGTDVEAQTAVRESIGRAERIGRAIEERFWALVPQKQKVPMQGIRDQLRAVKERLVDDPFSRPDKELDELIEMGLPTRGANGRMVPAELPTIARLLAARRNLRRLRLSDAGKARAGGQPNPGLQATYNEMEAILNNGIADSMPSSVPLQQARAVSVKYNNLFSRGPLGDVMAGRPAGDAVVDAGSTVSNLMRRADGLPALREVTDTIGGITGPAGVGAPQTQRGAFGRFVRGRASNPRSMGLASTPEERIQLQQLREDAYNSLYTMFRESTDVPTGKAAAGVSFLQKTLPKIRALSTAHAKLEFVGNKLRGLMAQEKMVRESALAQFAGGYPRDATSRLFNAKNPAEEARGLMESLKGSPDAVKGLKASVLDEFMRRTKLDPLKMRAALDLPLAKTDKLRFPLESAFSDPKTRDLFEVVFDKNEMARIHRIVNVGVRLAAGDERTAAIHFRPGLTILARIFAAHSAHLVDRFLGGSTLQAPQMASTMAKRAMDRAFAQTSPKELMLQAFLDQNWEKMMLKSFPTNTKQMRDVQVQMQRILAAGEELRRREEAILDREAR